MKIKDIVAVVGKYTDPQTGREMSNFKTVGELHKKDDSLFILMDKSFNLASVLQKNIRDAKVLLSLYDPKNKQQSVPKGPTAQQYRNAKNNPDTDADFDDEIAF